MIRDNLNLDEIVNKPHKLGNWLGYDLLSDIHSEWIKNAWKKDKTYILQAHRNSYKTTAVLVVGAIWYLFFNPDHRILIARKEFEGAASVIGEITKHYEGEKLLSLYSEVYGINKVIAKSKKDSLTLTTKTRITKEGNIESIGVGGSITGRHYEKVQCDDIVTIKDRVSKAERESTKIFIRELKNIPVVPHGTITVTGTPWDKDDGFSILPEADKYPVGRIKIPGFTKEFLNEIREGTTASLYAINYDLKHIADADRLFPEPVYREWPDVDKGESFPIRAYIDPAYHGKNTTSLTLLGKYKEEWYGRGWVWRVNIIDLYDKIVNICVNYNCGTMYVEANADKGLSVRDLKQKYPTVKPKNEGQNKHNKIVSFAVQHFRKINWAHDCQPEYMVQVLDYREGEEPDDAPDGLAALMRELGFSGSTMVKKPKTSAGDMGL